MDDRAIKLFYLLAKCYFWRSMFNLYSGLDEARAIITFITEYLIDHILLLK